MSRAVVDFHSLPVAALLQRGDRIVAVNAAYTQFMGAPAEAIVGRAVADLVNQFVQGPDLPIVGSAARAQQEGRHVDGRLWVRVNDFAGNARAVLVEWHPGAAPDENVVFLLDAEVEMRAKAAAEGLARAAGELGRCCDEREILERAADVLHARGLIVTTLLLRDGDPLLEYGPMRSTVAPERGYDANAPAPLRSVRPRREVLWELNPDFHRRRATFFQDLDPLIAAAYPREVSERLRALVPTRRTVQAPLFVNDAPYGALVLTGDELTPSLAGSIEMFAELVARAIENVRLRTELVQRERLAALGEAAAVMAHEVRNPIAAILNARALIESGRAAGAEADLLRVIGEEAHRLDRLVTDLLELGRPLAPRIVPVSLARLAERSVDVLRERGETEGIEIVVRAEMASTVAAADPDLAQLALWNVLRNAVQASPRGGRVTIGFECRGEQIALMVDDQGPGFPSEHAERVLEPFYTTRATGTGIGLAVVRRVVEALRSSIEIGAAPGGGGRFAIVFPRPV